MNDQHGSVTKNLIVATATALFREKGYHATSVRDIAKAAGVALGSIHYHFLNKEAILESVISPSTSLPPLEAIAATPQPVEERLRSIIGHLVAENLESRDKFWVLLHDMRSLSPEAHDVLQRSLRRRRKIVEELIVEGVEAGVFAVGNPAFVALNLIEMIDSIALWYRSGGSFGSVEIADGIASFAFNGLVGRRSHS